MKTLKQYQTKYGKLEGEKQYHIDKALQIEVEQHKNKVAKPATKKAAVKKQPVKKAVVKSAAKKTTTKKCK